MSIFFASGNISDSESESNEEIVKNEMKPSYDFGDDVYGADEKRKIVTEKDKKWNAIKLLCNKIDNFLNNQDLQKVWDHLQDLIREVEKGKKLFEKEGRLPSFFVKTLIRLDNDILSISSEDKKKLSKNAATAFNIMKQKLKNKILPEFEADIAKFKENEEGYSSESSEFSEQSSSESESSSDDEDEKGNWKSQDIVMRRKYFLRREVKKSSSEKGDSTVRKDSRDVPAVSSRNESKAESKASDINKILKGEKPKFNLTDAHKKKTVEIKSVKEAEVKIKAIINDFHKLTTKDQREEYLDNLNEIVRQASSYKDFEKLSFLLVDIPIRIQVYRQMKLTHFDRHSWDLIYRNIEIIYKILRDSEEDDLLSNVMLFSEDGASQELPAKDEQQQEKIYQSIQAFLVVLESELRKAFIFLDKSDNEYSERMQDLIKLVDFMYRVSRDLSFHDDLVKQTNELSFKVLENTYFMSSSFMKRVQEGRDEEYRFIELGEQNTLQEFADPILKSGNPDMITKTILYLVFNHAVNQRQKARQLLITSNVPDIIHDCDYYTQAMFNRCIVQIGITSFFYGKYHETQQFLSEICGYGKNRDQTKDIIKEFLAQGHSRTQNDREIPKNKILPYYLHLNVELIESLELIASMVLEVPYTLTEGGRISSRTFKKVYFEYERSHFIAEPLNNRDLIYAASTELKQGNWQQCYNRLCELEIWSEIENHETSHENMLQIVKEFSLKCHILANRKCFKSVSLQNLCGKFELEERVIKKLICKWIYSRDIQGSINGDGFLVLVQKKQSQMQKLCENLFNKLEDIRKSHEQTMEQRFSANDRDDEEDAEKDRDGNRMNRRVNLAMNERLKSILSRRG